jgi:hypothetical protein
VPIDLTLLADGVENPANRERIAEAAALLGGQLCASVLGRLIAVENTPTASSVYGRRPARAAITLAVGNERRGVSRRLLAAAGETVVIPTLSRTVSTLNVAAAAAVAGWYVSRGSGGQARRPHPECRRPMVLISGVESSTTSSSPFERHARRQPIDRERPFSSGLPLASNNEPSANEPEASPSEVLLPQRRELLQLA